MRLDPLQPEPHNNLANVLSGKHEFAEAEFEYRRALAINPQYADAHHGLGLLLIVTKRAEKAGAELEAAANEAPGNAQSWVDLGDVRSAEGRRRMRPRHMGARSRSIRRCRMQTSRWGSSWCGRETAATLCVA